MSKRNRERRLTDAPAETAGNGGGMNWLPIALAIVALGLGFMAWTEAKSVKGDMSRRLSDLSAQIGQLQTQVANVAKAKAPSQGPDPNKVYTVKTDGSPAQGNPQAPIVIAEFSDYQ